MLDLPDLIKLTITLAAIVDIPGNIPMFLQQTAAMDAQARRRTALVAGVATAAVLILFANAGEAILATFGISIHAFRVLGGLVVLLIALDMLGLLGAASGDAGPPTSSDPILIGVFLMAVPLFAGPGAITAVMVYAHEADKHDDHDLHVSIIILVVSALIVLGLLAASLVSRFITPVAQAVLNRLLGIIVGALAVEFILEGLAGFFYLESVVR
ncbi:MAG: MarC family protein [Pseudomonadota bacterium]